MTRTVPSLALIALITLLLAACGKTPDKEQIEQNLAEMKAAIENKEFSAIQKHLHQSFIANDQLDARAVKGLLQMYSVRHRSIDVTIVASDTVMDPVYPTRATTTVSVIVTGSSGLLPSDGSVRNVKIEWIKESDDWQVIKAQWRP